MVLKFFQNFIFGGLLREKIDFGPCILSLDAGTTSSRAMLVSSQSDDISICQESHGKPGGSEEGKVEYCAEKLLEFAIHVMKGSISDRKAAGIDVTGLAITNQRETFVTWDQDTGIPYAPAIVWLDNRTAKDCEELRSQGDNEEKFKKLSGLIISPYFTVSKLRWLLKNCAALRDGIEKGKAMFGTLDTWFVWNLTNKKVYATDTTNASRVGLMNIESLEWDKELKEMWGIDERLQFPEIRRCNDSFGTVVHEKLAGTPIAGKPIFGVIGDQHAALVGNGCLSSGNIKTTFGTGAFFVVNTGRKRVYSKKLLTTIAYHLVGEEPVYALEGAIGSCGTAISSLVIDGRLEPKEKKNGDDNSNEPNVTKMKAVLASVDDGAGGVVTVPAVSGLFAPYWCFDAETCTYFHAKAKNGNFVHATLEGIAFQVADVLSVARGDMKTEIKEHRVDGGVSNSDTLMKYVADVTRVSVCRSKNPETTALGAAFIAGLNPKAAVYSKVEDLVPLWQLGRSFQPQGDLPEIERKQRVWDGCVKLTIEAGNMKASIE